MIIINKRNLFFLISVWLLSTLLSAQNVTISTPQTQLLLSVPNGGTPEQLYYGSRTSDADIRSICETACRRNAYPVYGMGYPCETALSVRHADGNLTLQMAVRNTPYKRKCHFDGDRTERQSVSFLRQHLLQSMAGCGCHRDMD